MKNVVYKNVKKIYGPYKRKDGRKHVIIYFLDGTRKTVSYPKFLMENHLGRLLKDWETVDHIDEDHTNDSIDNLQILSLVNNAKKSALLRPTTKIKVNCKRCGKEISRHMAQYKGQRKVKYGYFCNSTCRARFMAPLISEGIINNKRA